MVLVTKGQIHAINVIALLKILICTHSLHYKPERKQGYIVNESFRLGNRRHG